MGARHRIQEETWIPRLVLGAADRPVQPEGRKRALQWVVVAVVQVMAVIVIWPVWMLHQTVVALWVRRVTIEIKCLPTAWADLDRALISIGNQAPKRRGQARELVLMEANLNLETTKPHLENLEDWTEVLLAY